MKNNNISIYIKRESLLNFTETTLCVYFSLNSGATCIF